MLIPKFRAKTKNGEWVYGTGVVQVEHNTYDTDKWELVQKVNYDELDYFIPSYETEEIDINTLGQYTGLNDKNEKELYNGDEIDFSYDIFVGNFDTKVAKGIIKLENGAFWVNIFDKDESYLLYEINIDTIEKIGNIYDN